MRKIFTLLLALLFAGSLNAQYEADMNLIDTVPAYNTGSNSYFLEYLEYQTCVDSNDVLHVLSIENYELRLYESSDSGLTWTKTSLTTGDEGDHYSAMMTLTTGGKRVIIYGINPYINYGTSLSGYYLFRHGTGAYVETSTGWVQTTLHAAGGSNTGLIPFCIYTDDNGMVHAFLHQRGWYTYGGYIHETIYNPNTETWSPVTQIYGYSQTIDRMTAYYARCVKDAQGNLCLLYRKQQSANPSLHELCVLKQVAGSWSGASPVIIHANYPQTYWFYDLETDNAGNFYFTTSLATGANGPMVCFASNSFIPSDTLYPFNATDTLNSMKMVYREGMDPLLIFNLRNVGKKIYEYDGTSLTQINDFYFPDTNDSTLYYGYAGMPWKAATTAHFGSKDNIYLIYKEYQGRDPNNSTTVLPQPFYLTRLYFPAPSTKASIEKFTIPGYLATTIDTTNHEIGIIMPAGADLTSLTPDTIDISAMATVDPGVGVTQDFTYPVQYTVTAQDTSVKVVWTVTVTDNSGIPEDPLNRISVYPNPVSDILYINMKGNNADIQLFDITGKILREINNFQSDRIDVSSLVTGIYLLKIKADGSSRVIRIVVN